MPRHSFALYLLEVTYPGRFSVILLISGDYGSAIMTERPQPSGFWQ